MEEQEWIKKFNEAGNLTQERMRASGTKPRNVKIVAYTVDRSTGEEIEVDLDWEPTHRDFMYPVWRAVLISDERKVK